MTIMTPANAAMKVKADMGGSKQPKTFSACVMEGLYIPDGTFDDFVSECEKVGLTIHSYWVCELAVISD